MKKLLILTVFLLRSLAHAQEVNQPEDDGNYKEDYKTKQVGFSALVCNWQEIVARNQKAIHNLGKIQSQHGYHNYRAHDTFERNIAMARNQISYIKRKMKAAKVPVLACKGDVKLMVSCFFDEEPEGWVRPEVCEGTIFEEMQEHVGSLLSD